MFDSIGGSEWLIILLIIVLLFGGKKIPELFKGVGEAVKEFKKSTDSEEKKE
jgi:sec-independent protein translocase protein TatA